MVATGNGIVFEVERLDWRADCGGDFCGKMAGPQISKRAMAVFIFHRGCVSFFNVCPDCHRS